MTRPEQDEKLPLQTAMSQMAGLAGQIAGLTLFLVFAAVLGGRWLDRVLGTGNAFLVILVLAAGPLALFLTFRLALRAARRVALPPSRSAPRPDDKEDENVE